MKAPSTLKQVSFEVRRGEVLGIIGNNGAGGSTFLKVLSRITRPTSGRAEMHGRVGSPAGGEHRGVPTRPATRARADFPHRLPVRYLKSIIYRAGWSGSPITWALGAFYVHNSSVRSRWLKKGFGDRSGRLDRGRAPRASG
jgi:energy-coupling factor transporter ATP-binding protein EcfA2